VEGNNAFALELYAKLREDEGNLFFSPYSISAALAMTYGGARGETALQMADVLNFSLPQEKLHPAFGMILQDLNARGRKGSYELTVANALWGQKGYGFLKEFTGLIETSYGGQLNEIDFVAATEAARQTINAWVEKETKDKIKELIKPGMVDELTRLVLTNAIYFKGNWAEQFKKEYTRDAPFTMLSGKKIDVPMMNKTAEVNYMETEDFQGLELPYVDNELSMIILLPKEANGLTWIEKTLTIENLSEWLARLDRCKVVVSIPKLKITNEFELADVLKSMGMTRPFEPMVADFSGINGKKGEYGLVISKVIHKAYVNVNEEGTEAVAATVVLFMPGGIGPRQRTVFRADHPFLFLIRDNHSGSILFIGRVMNPKG
jgi:serpin B